MPKSQEFVFVTGLSGAGKTTALKSFEDLGFFCIDNLPPVLVPTFIDLCNSSTEEVKRVAIGIDVRERQFLNDFLEVYKKLKEMPYGVKLIFIDSSDESLVRRFIETRRPHPLAFDKPVIEGIAEERQKLDEIKNIADQIVDTTNLTVHDLRRFILQLFPDIAIKQELLIHIVSFGFKYSLPFNADLVIDVRFLANPYFVAELKNLSGNNEVVNKYIMSHENSIQFLEILENFLSFLIPHYQKEGKKYLTLAFGCTGGKHRSVCIAEHIKMFLKDKGYVADLQHRDINK